MKMLLSIIEYLAIVALFGSAIYARALYLELKSTKEKLENAKTIIIDLKKELQEAQKQIEKHEATK